MLCLFKYMRIPKSFHNLGTTLYLKSLREYTNIKPGSKGLNWPQGKSYNNHTAFCLFYSYLLKTKKRWTWVIVLASDFPGHYQEGCFQNPGKVMLTKKHRASPPWTPASSSTISCVISTNIQHRRQLLDYIKLGGKKTELKPIKMHTLDKAKLFSCPLPNHGKKFRKLRNKTTSDENLAR